MKSLKISMNSSPIISDSSTCTDSTSPASSTSSQTNDLKAQHSHKNMIDMTNNITTTYLASTNNDKSQQSVSHNSLSSFSKFSKNNANSESIELSNYRRNNNRGVKMLKQEIIKTMLKQESTTYTCHDYFYSLQPSKLLIHPRKVNDLDSNNKDNKLLSPKSTSSSDTTATTTSNSSISSADELTTTSSSPSVSNSKIKIVDVSCRHKICEWIYRLINFFDIDRETAYYSVSYLDRFMMHYKTDRHTYKLLATTTLFLALKVHHPRKLILNNVVDDLSKGEFDMKDVDRMELIMLGTLKWSLYPPTPKGFVERLLDLQQSMIRVLNQNVPSSLLKQNDDDSSHDSMELFFDAGKIQAFAVFFAELSVFDYYFVTQRQSRVAMAAIMNSIEGLGLFEAIELSESHQIKRLFYTIISTMFDLVCVDIENSESYNNILQMRKRLWKLYQNSEEMNNLDSTSFKRREKSDFDVGLHNYMFKTNNSVRIQ